MNAISGSLQGICPGSHKDTDGRSPHICQACDQRVGTTQHGVVRSHYKDTFQYVSPGSGAGELEYTGLEVWTSGSNFFGLAARGWGTDRVAVRMAFSLEKIKRLHDFLGSLIINVEQECGNDPVLDHGVNQGSSHMKQRRGPTHGWGPLK